MISLTDPALEMIVLISITKRNTTLKRGILHYIVVAQV